MPKKKKQFTKLVCSICKKINYYTKKSKGAAGKKLELKKYCRHCKKHTIHKELR